MWTHLGLVSGTVLLLTVPNASAGEVEPARQRMRMWRDDLRKETAYWMPLYECHGTGRTLVSSSVHGGGKRGVATECHSANQN